MDETFWRFNDNRTYVVDDRNMEQLIGLANGILADGIVNQAEAETLRDWMRLNAMRDNPLTARLLDLVEAALADGVLDDEESAALHDALMDLTGEPAEEGEMEKAATLPLDPAPREVGVEGNSFAFTGTAAAGTRKAMYEATEAKGGTVHKTVTSKTNYLVLGTYVTPSWIHSSFGRKIEQAIMWRDVRQSGLRIVHEEDWARAVME